MPDGQGEETVFFLCPMKFKMKGFKFKFPILMRLTILMTMLIGAVAFVIASKNSEFFKNFSKTREESAELLEVKTHAAQINTLVEIFTEKIKLYATDLIAESQREEFGPLFVSKFNNDQDLMLLEIYKRETGEFRELAKIHKAQEVEAGFAPPIYSKSEFAKVFEGEVLVKERRLASVKNSDDQSLLNIMIPLVKEVDETYSHIAVASFKLNKVRRAFAEILSRNVYLTDDRGNLLAHSKGDMVKEFENVSSWPLVKKAGKSEIKLSQITDNLKDFKGNDIQGAFSKTPFGLVVFSETQKDFILGPSKVAKEESLYWLGIILSGSFFLVFVFSTTITNPIEKLQRITEEIASGNFEVSAAAVIRSHDEVGDLAVAFDNMTDGLRERDKIKNVMNKFHGSAITDELMNSELEKRGSRKDCVIYFSDIRGFTDYSERHSAEEVVEMLNDYFEIMVGIIMKHGGVVDKFIGDAIMAVWGAPTGTPEDPQKAVAACLEMRKALVGFNERRIAENKEPIKVGMGLHMGDVISGTLGSSERMEFTVIGDNVNMAARIEASTKAFGADVLLSQQLAEACEEGFVVKLAGGVEVKGKSSKLNLYSLHGYKRADGTVEIVETPYSSYQAEKADKVKVG